MPSKALRTTVAGAALLLPLLTGCSSDSDTTSTTPAASSGSASGSAAAMTAESTGASAEATTPAPAADLAGTKWSLKSGTSGSIDLAEAGITLDFDATTASGFAGVNQYNGGYTATADGGLTFGPFATTMMAGSDEAMAAEAAYLAVLPTVTGYRISGSALTLLAEDAEVLTYAAAG